MSRRFRLARHPSPAAAVVQTAFGRSPTTTQRIEDAAAPAFAGRGSQRSPSELEDLDGLHQTRRLAVQAVGGRGGFFDQRRVLLGHLIELVHRAAYLPDA